MKGIALAAAVGLASAFAAAPVHGAPSAVDLPPAFPQGGAQAPPPGQTVIPDPEQFEANAPTDDAELEANVRKLSSQLRCPTCQALSIADSPSELAREMEGVIRQRLQAGMTPDEVRQSFVASYGEWILLSPNPAGFNLLIYILPVAALLFGAGLVVVAMRRWLATPSGQESVPPAS